MSDQLPPGLESIDDQPPGETGEVDLCGGDLEPWPISDSDRGSYSGPVEVYSPDASHPLVTEVLTHLTPAEDRQKGPSGSKKLFGRRLLLPAVIAIVALAYGAEIRRAIGVRFGIVSFDLQCFTTGPLDGNAVFGPHHMACSRLNPLNQQRTFFVSACDKVSPGDTARICAGEIYLAPSDDGSPGRLGAFYASKRIEITTLGASIVGLDFQDLRLSVDGSDKGEDDAK